MLYTSSMDILSNAYIVRIGNEVINLKDNSHCSEITSEPLCSLRLKDYSFYYHPNEIKANSDQYEELKKGNSTWLVLKHTKNYENERNLKQLLSKGDVLKIGRIWLKIKKIQIDNGLNLNTSMNIDQLNDGNNENQPKKSTRTTYRSLTDKGKGKNVCRICYGEEKEGDPLIQPCICSGTMKYIHYSCLRTWIHSRTCVKPSLNTNCITYIITKIECELCKAALPDFVKHNGELYELLDFNQSFDNYIVFETLSIDSHGKRFLYYVNFNKENKMTIGRGQEANLVVGEISVSRIHCMITKQQKTIYLEDNASKFGTLVLMQAPYFKIIQGLPLSVQIGRTNLNISIKQHFNFFTCFRDNDYDNSNSYDLENIKFIDTKKYITVKEETNTQEEQDANESFEDKKTVFNGKPFLKLELYNQDKIEEEYKLDHYPINQRKITSLNDMNTVNKENDVQESNHITSVIPKENI